MRLDLKETKSWKKEKACQKIAKPFIFGVNFSKNEEKNLNLASKMGKIQTKIMSYLWTTIFTLDKPKGENLILGCHLKRGKIRQYATFMKSQIPKTKSVDIEEKNCEK